MTVGVQDSWVNSCAGNDKATTPDYTPTTKDPSVPAVDSGSWKALGAGTVRFSPEWDIADPLTPHVRVVQECFTYWLDHIPAHVGVEIAFKPDTDYKTTTGRVRHVRIPTLRQYVAAMKAFLKLYPRVKIISPWGEPEFHPKGGKGPDYQLANGSAFDATRCPPKKATDANCGPALAAQMWVAVRQLCPSCKVIAGDFGSNQGKDFKYLAIYQRFLRDIHGGHRVYHPAIWAIHPYTDVLTWEHEIKYHQPLTAPQNTLVARFAAQLSRLKYHGGTQIWLDEVSSFTKSPSLHKGERYSRSTQAAGARELLTRLVKAGGASTPGEPTVKRIYYMRFAGKTPDALIVNGHREPVFTAVANWQKSHHHAAKKAKKSRRHAAKKSKHAKRAATATRAKHTPAATRYELKSAAGNLCLDANDLGPTAGSNGDKVRLWTCYGGASQQWIPQVRSGQLGWLASAKYPGMCLNANDIGGLKNGRAVQLWNCYDGANELWNVAAIAASPNGSPLYLGNGGAGSLALDANKYDLANGDKAQIWSYYGAQTQLWSLVPAQ